MDNRTITIFKVIIFLLVINVSTSLAQNSFTALNGIPGGDFREIHEDSNGRLYAVERGEQIVYYTDDDGVNWQPYDAVPSGVYAFYADGSSLYYFTYNQMYKSIDNGSTWTKINATGFNSFRNVSRAIISPFSSTTWFIEAGCEGVFVSTDDGVNWIEIDNETCNSGQDGSYRLAVTPNGDVYWINERQGVSRQKRPLDDVWDKSNTELVFTKLTSGDDNSLAIISNDAGKILILHRSALNEPTLSTSETGDNGSYVNLALPVSTLSEPELSKGFDGTLHLVDNQSDQMYALTDENTPTWTTKTHPTAQFGTSAEVFLTWISTNEVYATSNIYGIFWSTDNGSSWLQRNGTGNNTISAGSSSDVEVLANGNIVVFPSNGPYGAWVSSDQGVSFTFHAFGARAYQRGEGTGLTQLQNGSLLINTDDGMRHSTDGKTWTLVSNEGFSHVIPMGTDDVYFVRGDEFIYHTTTTDITNGGGLTIDPPVSAGLPSSSYMLFAEVHESDIYINLDNGGVLELWKVETSGAPATFTSQKLIHPFSSDASFAGLVSISNKLYISDREQVAFSTNQGVSWAIIDFAQHERLLGIDQESGGIALASYGSFSVTQDDGQTWRTVGLPKTSNFINEIAQDAGGNFIASVQSGSMAKLTDKLILNASELPASLSISWNPLNGPFGGNLDGLQKDNLGNIFSYGRGAGIFKYNAVSQDWERRPTGIDEARDLFIDSNNDLYSINCCDITKSTDNGSTWSLVSQTGINDPMRIVIANNGNIVCSTYEGGEGIYVSTDAGISYTTPLGAGSKGQFWHLEKSGTGRLWTHQRFNDQSTIYTSTDDGINWTVLGNVDLSGGKRLLSINVLEGNTVVIVTTDDMLRSTDDGTSWTSIKGSITQMEASITDPGISKVYLAPNGDYYFYNHQFLYQSQDQGLTWTQVGDISASEINISGLIFDGSDLIATSNYGSSVNISTNGGGSFSTFNNAGLTGIFGSQGSVVLAPERIISTAGGKTFDSTDDGQTFNDRSSLGYFEHVYKAPSGRLVLYGSNVSFSDDNGANWSTPEGGGWFDPLFSNDGMTYYAVRSSATSEIVSSTDLVNWSALNITGLPADIGIRYMVVDDNNSIYINAYNQSSGAYEVYKIAFGAAEEVTELRGNTQFLNYYNGKVIAFSDLGRVFSTIDGTNWSTQAVPPGNHFSISENGYYFISDDNSGKVWISKDEGSNWQAIDGFNGSPMFQIEVSQTNGYAYAVVSGQSLLKSNSIILPNDNTNPAIVSPGGFLPENGAINVALDFTFSITFDENVKAIAGKKIRLLESSNPSSALEIFDATDAVFSNGNTTVTFTPTIAIDFSTKYFIAMDAGAFTDIFDNPASGIASASIWEFTTLNVPDNQDPSISVTTTDLTYIKGTPKVFDITVTDNIEVDALGAKIYYRKISDLDGASFKSANMTTSSSDAAAIDFTITSSDSWFDAMGLEFYFEAADKAGRIKRSPDVADTYLYSYTDYGTSKPKLEGLSFGETTSSYSIMAVPYDLIDNQIGTQFDELGEFSKEKFRIGNYNTVQEKVDEYPAVLKTFGRGKGYWVLMRNFTDIELENATSPENNRTDFFTLNLQQGWNQIGNPYPVAISWDEVRAQDADVGQLKTYNNGNFSNGDVLQAYRGGFVFAQNAVNDLKVRFQGITTGGRIAGTSADLLAEHWEVPITIAQGEFSNAIGGIGMHKESINGKDRRDDYNPPTITHRLELAFKTKEGNLAKSVVNKQGRYSWDFTAHAEGEGDIILKWDNLDFGVNDINLILYDEERVKLIDMRNESSYTYQNSPNKKFKVFYGEMAIENIMPEANILGDPYPNPTSDQLSIPFAISSEMGDAEVNIKLYNGQGQLVKIITDNKFAPGAHTVLWENKDIIKTGIHILIWQAKSANGEFYQETKRILLK